MEIGPREIVTPFRSIPLDVPEGMAPNEGHGVNSSNIQSTIADPILLDSVRPQTLGVFFPIACWIRFA